LSFTLIYAQKFLLTVSRYRYLNQIGESILRTTFNADWSRLSGLTKGEVISRLTVQNYRCGQALLHLMNLLAAGIQITVYLVLSAMISVKLVVLALASYLLLGLLVRPLLKKMASAGAQSTKLNDYFATIVVDHLSLAKVFKVFKKEESISQKLVFSYRNVLHVFKDYDLSDALMTLMTQIIPVLTVYAIFIYSVVFAGLEISSLLVLIMIYTRMGAKIALLNQSYGGFLNNQASLLDLDQFLNKNLKSENFQNTQVKHSQVNEIQLENVCYSYPNTSVEQLKNVNLRLQKGKLYAMLGASGSGKSTLMDLILGLRTPTRGKTYINGKIETLIFDKNVIGYVPQEAFIYKGTVKENITFGEDYSDQAIWDVLELVGLKSDIEKLPSKLETFIGEGDLGLSGGQKQRLAIARSLIIKPSLLVLDEATSGLDQTNEEMVRSILEKIKADCLILVITHRPEFARGSDHIIRVHAGEIQLE
jgi:ATP-binding cassette subfamily C protein